MLMYKQAFTKTKKAKNTLKIQHTDRRFDGKSIATPYKNKQ